MEAKRKAGGEEQSPGAARSCAGQAEKASAAEAIEAVALPGLVIVEAGV